MNYKLSVLVYQDFNKQWIVDARIDGSNEKIEYSSVTEAVAEASRILTREKVRWNC